MAEIVMIPVNRIEPHPDNPRKALGDLQELTESIRRSGVLQNLTVVPWFSEITKQPADDGKMAGWYRAIIGHRRLAAAKAAGLTEVPCVICDMDYKEQLATMLAENMQRADLTTIEQAEGIQMMLDLGESVRSVAERTGLSESTVRRRTKLMELDRAALVQAEERGATLADYARLDKLRDPAAKNRALAAIGTRNFETTLQHELDRQRCMERKETYIAVLAEFAEPRDDIRYDTPGVEYVRNFSYYGTAAKVEIPADAGERKYWYKVCDWQIDLYREVSDEEETEEDEAEAERRREREERQNRIGALEGAFVCAKQARLHFLEQLSEQDALHALPELVGAACWVLVQACSIGYKAAAELVGLVESDEELLADDEKSLEILRKAAASSPARMLAAFVSEELAGEMEDLHDWEGRFNGRMALWPQAAYRALAAMGYEIGDEERTLLNGSSELYLHDKEET